MKFTQGQRVRKVGGAYQAYGVIASAFTTKAGKELYVFEFDNSDGMFQILGLERLEAVDPPKLPIEVGKTYRDVEELDVFRTVTKIEGRTIHYNAECGTAIAHGCYAEEYHFRLATNLTPVDQPEKQ